MHSNQLCIIQSLCAAHNTFFVIMHSSLHVLYSICKQCSTQFASTIVCIVHAFWKHPFHQWLHRWNSNKWPLSSFQGLPGASGHINRCLKHLPPSIALPGLAQALKRLKLDWTPFTTLLSSLMKSKPEACQPWLSESWFCLFHTATLIFNTARCVYIYTYI